MSEKIDPLTPQLRAAEEEIDNAYKANQLTIAPICESAWYFLAICEEEFMRQVVQSDRLGVLASGETQAMLAHNVTTHAKNAMKWLWDTCPQGGRTPRRVDPRMYDAAWRLSTLAQDYMAFENAFTFGSYRILELSLSNRRIASTSEITRDSRFQAYDWLIDLSERSESAPDTKMWSELIRSSVRVKGEWFDYQLNPRVVKDGMSVLGTYLDHRFKLPPDWILPRYTIGDFAEVVKVIWLLGMIHLTARIEAARNGCIGLGLRRAVLLYKDGELERRLLRYSGIPRDRTLPILEDLTYSGRGVKSPDPLLQPLIPIARNIVAISPSLAIHSSLERNMTVLLNRLPEERKAYSRLRNFRERLLRDRMTECLSVTNLRSWHGTISEWDGNPEIDLVLTSDADRCLLVLELKSFIAPAEARELYEKSQEIARGIEQVRFRRSCYELNPEPLLRAAHGAPGYSVGWAVVSETCIGGVWVQVEDVPVVRSDHLIRKILTTDRLSSVSEWLAARSYLPIEGTHYTQAPIEVSIAGWTLEWFTFEPLLSEYL